MEPRDRIAAAMRLEKPDRVPVMCQPSWGFVLKQLPGVDPVDLWHNRDGIYPEAFSEISRRFGFDGVLIPAVGLAPLPEEEVAERKPGNPAGPLVTFASGDTCTYCRDDLPMYRPAADPEITIDELDVDQIPETIAFHTPSQRLRMWMNEDPYGRVAEIHQAREVTGGTLSIHGSAYAPEDYLIDRLGLEAAFMAMMTHPDKCREALLRYADALIRHVGEQIDAGVDAVNFSAPWTGQNFIGLDMYESIILPAQAKVAQYCRERGVPCYCHTCGSIGDRLEMIVEAGFSGLECLDPPPLGNVKLEDAVRRIGDRAFIKGNIDPVNVLMNGTPEQVREDARHRVETGMEAGGFILSTACSIAPSTPARNVEVLREVVEEYGRY